MENFKQIPQIDPEEEKKTEEINHKAYPERERIDKLKRTDNHYEDSIMDLAKAQNEFWDELKEGGTNKESINKLSSLYGDQVLKSIENKKESYVDKLTEIPNRRSLNETIPKFLSLGKRKNQNSAILMLDIDHFKQVNDEFGHDAGDKTLKEIVNVIKDSIRNSDFVFRYGGEEFTVFLPDTDTDGAQRVAENIRKNIEKAKILDRTMSFGCVSTNGAKEWSEEQKEIDMQEIMNDLIKKADKALYYSKNNGRNQVTPYSEELVEEKK